MYKLAVLQSDWTAKILQRVQIEIKDDSRPLCWRALEGVASPDYDMTDVYIGGGACRKKSANWKVTPAQPVLDRHRGKQYSDGIYVRTLFHGE